MAEEKDISCAHDKRDPEYVCPHMLEKVAFPGWKRLTVRHHCRWFSGKGVEYRLVCVDCAKMLPEREPALIPVCRPCFQALEQAGQSWNRVGDPEVLEAREQLDFESAVASRSDYLQRA